MSVDFVFGEEFRIVNVTGDEVSDHSWHSIYPGGWLTRHWARGNEEKRTLGIEEDGAALNPKVLPLEHALEFWNIFLSVRSHWTGAPPLGLKQCPT